MPVLMAGERQTAPMSEEQDYGPPQKTNVHTVEECDRMLRLPLAPQVADAWLDERDLARMAEESWRDLE